MKYRYSDLISLYPNIVPNSRNPNYRKVKARYDKQVDSITTLEDSLHAILRVLNDINVK